MSRLFLVLRERQNFLLSKHHHEHSLATLILEIAERLTHLLWNRSQVAVVTGGGSGIGSMVAAGLVSNGAKCYIVSRKDCSALANELTSRGPGQCVVRRRKKTQNLSETHTTGFFWFPWSLGCERCLMIIFCLLQSLQSDIAKEADVEALVEKLKDLEPRGIHVLVNNAGPCMI